MKSILSIAAVASISVSWAGVSHKITQKEYVDQWSGVAVEQMAKFGIPASITLAQGILESGNGNSELALKGNNHFGIKCHGWSGKKMYIDDDAKDECFRVYNSGVESYKDHSEFLKTYERYAFLFEYDEDDYKSWARGLKSAGYATNPKYPDLLIDLIENLELNQFDKLVTNEMCAPILASSRQRNTHTVNVHERGVEYVVVKAGDTYYSIAQEFGLTLSQLYRFNSYGEKKDFLEPGDIVYVRAKKSGSLFEKEEQVIEKSMTIKEISQKYAIRLKTLCRLNGWDENTKEIAAGEKIILR